jgi:serine/threonine-protein kinase
MPPENQPTDEDPVTDLVLRWEELREGGQEVPAEDLCRDRPELLEPLRRRIQALRDMDAVLEDPPARPAPAPPLSFGAKFTAVPKSLLLPQVPGYEVLGELGRGGMGVVYKARQLGPDRVVALKMILPRLCPRPADTVRFRREIKAVATIQHPNLVAVLDVGEHGGRPYYALEYVDGGSLETRAGNRPQPADQAAVVVEALARAMHVVHGRGIIHRDLKPANVLLARGDTLLPEGATPPLTWWTPKISDFGLARQVASEDGPTQSGAVLGTPGYLAPEQAEGRSRRVGPGADVFALGAILYYLLTGRPPFHARTPLDTIRLAATAEAVPPTKLEPGCPPELEVICLKCLEKSPAGRYPTAEALADDLGRFRRGESIRARVRGPLGKLVRSVWRAVLLAVSRNEDTRRK